MASSEILSQTLLSTTAIKLDQLSKQRELYESGKRTLFEDVAREENAVKRVRLLIEGAEALPAMTPLGAAYDLSTSNIKRFAQQAERDPCVTDDFLRNYESTIRSQLDIQSNKYFYASLYGKLVNQWISLGKSARVATPETDDGSDDDFVAIGREEMHQQRATWEEYVFKAKETDQAAIRAYLDDVFMESSKDVKAAIENLRKSVKKLQKSWESSNSLPSPEEKDVVNCIRGILRRDAVSDEKKATLREFLGNSVVITEITDVMKMKLSTWKTWAWEEALVVEQHRKLNGRYRFHTHEDLLQTIFLHYVGMRWASEFRGQLVKFVHTTGVWKQNVPPISKTDQRRREYFLGDVEPCEYLPVKQKKQRNFQNEIFLDHLPVDLGESRGLYGDESVEEENDTRPSHINVVQTLLHMIQTDIVVRKKLGGEMAVIRSDYKWFGPSLPHSSLFTVLQYFGVNAEWLAFFKRFLEAPLRFQQDTEDTQPQIRRRGTPLSTPLSDFFGELLLFVGDFAVNQQANGTCLYRLHDDMWLWGDTDACAMAWKALSRFANVVGLDFNLEKTGSVCIQPDGNATVAEATDGLPAGDVKWGFLKLDAASGRFLLNQADIKTHTAELRRQLAACRSVMDWTQAWNSYGVRFFATNFGRPAACFSRAHVDDMLAAFGQIQAELFPRMRGGAAAQLKAMVAEVSGGELKADDIPDGFVFYPTQFGGLGLQNPFIPLYLVVKEVVKDPGELVDKFLAEEEADYRAALARFNEGDIIRGLNAGDFSDLRDEPFMSLEEFTRYRERTSWRMGRLHNDLMLEPAHKAVEVTAGDKLKSLVQGRMSNLTDNGYDWWVVELFHKDIWERFGGVIVEKGLLPLGLMTMFRQSRFKWQS